ncbi:peptide ABC transporter substrate-binding protein [Horticoccus sp. 23ND18S-11]|uniref:peptide ABC transporter substrate-binding protein n=1 Tax=Horticoccus sp. 23ND18S-11 TaxID=3391832 RepID=UPI0039C9BA37
MSFRLNRPLLAVLALVAACSLSACKKRETDVTRGDQAGILHVGNGAEIQSLDPHLAGGAVDHNVLCALFEGLITLDETTFQPRPGVAERWEISPDGLTYTFYLRPGARWSNGDPLTANDFLYSFRRALTPSLGSEYKDALYPVRNAEAFARGQLENFALVGFRAHDDTTFEITLARPTPHFITVLRTNVAFPVHAASVERGGAKSDDRTAQWTRATPFVSNGPFRFREWKEHQHVALEKNPNYWDAAKVRLNAIYFHPGESTQAQELAFRAGQLHTTWDLPLSKVDAYRKDSPGLLRIEPYFESYFLRFNTKHRLFSDARLRIALSLAIDREAIVKNILRGGQTAATGLVPPGLGGYVAPGIVKYDVATAKKMLADAGYPGGKGLPPVELVTISSEINKSIAEAIQQMWRRDLGVKTQITQKEFKVLLDAFDTLDYTIARGRWIAEYPDPLTYLSIFTTGNGVNGTGFADSRYDTLLAFANSERAPAARLSALREVEQYLLSQMPIAPIYWGSRTTLVAASVKGWKNSPLGFHNYKDVWLEP